MPHSHNKYGHKMANDSQYILECCEVPTSKLRNQSRGSHLLRVSLKFGRGGWQSIIQQV